MKILNNNIKLKKFMNNNQILIIIFLNLQFVIKLINSATLQCLPCDAKPKSMIKPSSIANSNAPDIATTAKIYEEFLFEHQVTKQEAIVALNRLNASFFEGPREPGCKAIPCTDTVIKYCLGSQFLNDHCWCEQGHSKEGLPWIPHTCYVGDKIYTASIGSCYFFNEIKECCCNQVLAKQWKQILSKSSKIHENKWIIILITTLGCLFLKNIFIFPT